MKFKFLKAAFIGAILSVSGLANAVLINIGALTSNDDGSTTVITDSLNSLEWLRWDQLASLTHGETLTQISSGAYSGWSIAGVNEANLFLDALYNGSAHGCSVGTCGNNGAFTSAEYTALLGDSWALGAASGDVAWFYDDFLLDDSAGYLALTSGSQNGKIETYGTISKTDEFSAGGPQGVNIGWLLYREATAVNSPSTLAIFALGLIGLAARRSKK